MPAVWVALTIAAAASLAALYGHYRDLPAWLTGPTICKLDGNGCAVLFRTPRASLLGVPNAALGLLLYVILAIGVVDRWPWAWLLALMTPALVMSVFLAGSLIRNRRECRICWTGHIANAFLFAYFVVRAMQR